MSSSTKWYQRNGLIAILLIFLYPVGLVGVWLRDTHIFKKIFFSIMGLFVSMFTFFILLVVYAAIFIPTNHYKYGEEAFKRGNYNTAIYEFQMVREGHEKYDQAKAMIALANQKIQEEEKRKVVVAQTAKQEIKNNVRELISGKQNYTVILNDMNFTESGADTTFSHKYKIIFAEASLDSLPYEKTTDWMVVSDTTFDFYSSDMGMELLSEDGGQVNEQSSPPGYNRYVGNTRYGTWRTDAKGDSFWEFYGKYAFMTRMFGYSQPVYQYSYYDYRDYYRGRTSYYGTSTSGGYQYGTGSVNAQMQNPNPKSLSSKVQSRISRSGSRFNSRSSFKSNVNNSITRSSARVSRSSTRTSSVRGGSSSSRGGK